MEVFEEIISCKKEVQNLFNCLEAKEVSVVLKDEVNGELVDFKTFKNQTEAGNFLDEINRNYLNRLKKYEYSVEVFSKYN